MDLNWENVETADPRRFIHVKWELQEQKRLGMKKPVISKKEMVLTIDWASSPPDHNNLHYLNRLFYY